MKMKAESEKNSALNLSNPELKSVKTMSSTMTRTTPTVSRGPGRPPRQDRTTERNSSINNENVKEPPGPGGEENNIGVISQEMRKKLRDNIGISYVSPTTGKSASNATFVSKPFVIKEL